MKSFAVLATFAGLVLSQGVPMPNGDCSMLCINNMAKIAQSEFSCASDDLACFCTKSNWAYGIRDCSLQACDADQSSAAISWAYARCAGIAATATDTPAAVTILSSVVASATATSTSASAASGIASIISSAASAASSFTSSIASSVASDVSSLTASASSAVSSAESSAASGLASASSVLASISSALESATSSINSEVSSATGSAASAASTAVQGAAAQATAMPFMAGAGVVAWLLL